MVRLADIYWSDAMTPDVVTIYCCGTGQDRRKFDTYAVPYLFANTDGRTFICDGPGGAPIRKAEDILMAVESGEMPTAPNEGRFAKLRTKWDGFVWDRKFEKKHGAGLKQKIHGYGTADNVIISLQWLWEKWYKHPFTAINLCGWSRGGVTCLMLAHAIQEAGFPSLNPNLKVNVFTFDPVPGGKNDFVCSGTFDQTGRVGSPYEISSCVTHYASILQETLKRNMYWVIPKDGNFECTVPEPQSADTVVDLYPMPGGHGEACTFNNGKGATPVGQIGMHLAQKFLTDAGTELIVDDTQGPADLIELYAMIRLAYTEKKGLSKKAPSEFRKPLVKNPYRGHGFYVNSHHAELIRRFTPPLAECIDKQTPMTDGQRLFIETVFPISYAVLETLEIV